MPEPIHKVTLPDDFSFDMIFVEGGEFMMGSEGSQYDDERPVHSVKLSDYYVGKYPVTQKLWEAVMGGKNPSGFKGDLRPVENVSWEDAQQFLERLGGMTKKPFRLPTEAEWEFAARGGIYSEGYLYVGSDDLEQVGWYRGNSNSKTHEVGQLRPNELGLHDMSGNVLEWCEDDWHENYEGAPNDGSGWIGSPERGAYRVFRGGSCFNGAEDCRSAIRDNSSPGFRSRDLGFRLAVSPQSVG